MSIGDIVVIVLLGAAVGLALATLRKKKGGCAGCAGCDRRGGCPGAESKEGEKA